MLKGIFIRILSIYGGKQFLEDKIYSDSEKKIIQNKKDIEQKEVDGIMNDLESGQSAFDMLQLTIDNTPDGFIKDELINDLRIQKLRFRYCPDCNTREVEEENKVLIDSYIKEGGYNGLSRISVGTAEYLTKERFEEWESDFNCKNCNYSSHEVYKNIVSLGKGKRV